MIVVGMATIPERLNTLGMVLANLHPQVDRIELALNGFTSIPAILSSYPKVRATITTNEKGDANKFFNVHKYTDSYYFSCDDDILYPKDYVSTYIPYIDAGFLTSIHGANIPREYKLTSYYRGRKQMAHCLNNGNQVQVDIVGSGVSGFHTSKLVVDYDEFKHANMADIWLSMQAHEQGVKRLCITHGKGWIIGGLNKGRATIYETHKNKDSIQTDLVNSFNWK